ncbi:tannase/feruloyl esterase family alpha/beta hydrolase [Variovorax arabinosiphilus]|uniref:tannase/feruloyl esterase family alpha/beta hydrolase n=1 Tax=Variovorax arabinosiphilus TaxID=3053498 RepID=UPI002577A2B4|nr:MULTISPECIES: tannase/feruloyl esterase family alpha/beta hydrolase [unclassified Variovorax]MDM0122599.1 tannase/feruloyl esterase family alpha/beta hydrolase [Variovorax sp. J2L1-78]MDM0130872.1 tannase/feruloyl esterase family alpha/beta hydrolase [Variovorax sp. J2L1-63]MDM0235362.1 tannase/feruloyl esterase family alpha/beta hydrolase [Variovorax sp. J2R1-6]
MTMLPTGHPVLVPGRISRACFIAAAALLAGCGGGGGSDAPSGGGGESSTADVSPSISCASLAGQTVGNVQVTGAVPVAATAEVPAYCKVNGTQVGTQHDIEVRLPDVWQRRFVQQGGGGFDGSIPPVGAKNVALAQHAVLTANNGGHRDPSGAVLLNNQAVVQLYAHTAINVATKFGKAIAERYYAKTPSYSYYQGCSNGGRGALNAAAKYGSEFDAVIAGAPTRNLTGQIEQWTRASALAVPSPTKLTAINSAAVAKCDVLDGAKDGIVSNWSACQFDPTTDVPASVGLTPEEASAVKTLMTDLRLADGRTIYSGFGIGSMSQWGPAYASLGVGHMRNIVLNDASWAPSSFSVDAYYPTISGVIDGSYDFSASVSGLSDYLKAGKKIVVWHGSDDSLLSHKDTVRTWEPVVSTAGTAAQANARLYIASGVSHCGGGPGADTFDLLTPTMAWVEKGVDLGTPTASKVGALGETLFTRPLCQFSTYPKYNGVGDLNSATSYQCSAT